MRTLESIKTTYHDALFFASAPSNKKENFYLTPSEFKVIIKLMMYQRKNADITYQNKTIAEHIFLAESTVKDAMEALVRMSYISTELDVFNNGLGFKSKRTVKINWKRILEIDSKLQRSEEQEEIQPAPAPIKLVKVEIPVPVIENKIDSIDLSKFNIDGLRTYDEKYTYQNNGITANNYFDILRKLNKGQITFQQMLIECDEMIIEKQKEKAIEKTYSTIDK